MDDSQLINSAIKSLQLNEIQSAFATLSLVPSHAATIRDFNLAWAIFYLTTRQLGEARVALEREISLFPDNQIARQLFRETFPDQDEVSVTTCDIPFIGARALHLRRWPSSDESVYDQIFKQENYKPLITLINESGQTSKIHTILDAGANIGCAALYFAKHFPEAEILCIEPDDGNFTMLERNTKLDRPINIVALKAALWNSQCTLKVDPRFRDGREWARCVYESKEGTVPGISLSDLIEQQRWASIDILKIDIEGAERYLFSDHTAMLNALSKVQFIAIEIHDEFKCRAEIEGVLCAASFRISQDGELTFGVNQSFLSK